MTTPSDKESVVGLFRGLRIKLGLRKPQPMDVWPWPGISIGRRSYGVKSSSIVGYELKDGFPIGYRPGRGPLTVGSYCSIGDEVLFMCHADHRADFATTFPLPTSSGQWRRDLTFRARGPINVGHDVWIGRRAIIMSGITIGSGAIVGSGSIVTKDIPPYAIFAGNPARFIKWRFPPEIVDGLLSLQWWDWPDEKIKANADLLLAPPDKLLSQHMPGNEHATG